MPGKQLKLTKGSVVFYKGDVTTHVYFLKQGQVTVQNPHCSGSTYLISKLSAGSFLCDLEVLSQNMRNSTTLVAHTDCNLIKFRADDFLKQLKKDSEFLLFVSQLLAQKMYQEAYRLGDNLYENSVNKLITYLTTNYQNVEHNKTLVISNTRQYIASEIGVSVRTLNRSVKQLKEHKHIQIINGKIHLTEQHYAALLSLKASLVSQ